MLSGKPSVNLTKGRSIDSVGKIVGASRNTIKKAEEIVTASEQNPEKYQSLVVEMDSKKNVDKTYNKLKKEKKREELKSIKTDIELPPENCKLFCNDFTKIDSTIIPDNSIHLIITDPPYGEQYLYLYKDLANLALRVLKPGGSLVFLAGHIILNKILRIMDDSSSNLKYWWPIAVKHNGAKQRVCQICICRMETLDLVHKRTETN